MAVLQLGVIYLLAAGLLGLLAADDDGAVAGPFGGGLGYFVFLAEQVLDYP